MMIRLKDDIKTLVKLVLKFFNKETAALKHFTFIQPKARIINILSVMLHWSVLSTN